MFNAPFLWTQYIDQVALTVQFIHFDMGVLFILETQDYTVLPSYRIVVVANTFRIFHARN